MAISTGEPMKGNDSVSGPMGHHFKLTWISAHAVFGNQMAQMKYFLLEERRFAEFSFKAQIL